MNVLAKSRLSVKFQVIAGLAAIVGAVALPQLFHVIGAVSGLGTSLGETFLPMHIPVILAGFIAGPFAGAAAGAGAAACFSDALFCMILPEILVTSIKRMSPKKTTAMPSTTIRAAVPTGTSIIVWLIRNIVFLLLP